MDIFANPEHLTFDELGKAWESDNSIDVEVCPCWLAGHGDIKGLGPADVQHPREWNLGAQAAFEKDFDM